MQLRHLDLWRVDHYVTATNARERSWTVGGWLANARAVEGVTSSKCSGVNTFEHNAD